MAFLALAFVLAVAQAGEVPPLPDPGAPVPPVTAEPPVWLGVFLEDAADGGVQVLGLVPGGPADRGGVREGDVLLGVGSASVLSVDSLNETLRGMKPGQRAEIRLLRNGKAETVGLLLGDRTRLRGDDRVEETRGQIYRLQLAGPLGIGLQTIPAELRQHYGAPPDAGALVVKLEPQGPGARAGLRVGDVVIRAGLRPVADPADVTAGILSASTAEVPLEVVREHKTVRVTVSRPAVPRPPSAVYVDARTMELAQEVARLRARVAELEAELEKARRE